MISVIGSNNHWVANHFHVHYLIFKTMDLSTSLEERMQRNSDCPHKQGEHPKPTWWQLNIKSWTPVKINQATCAFSSTTVSDQGCK